MTQLDLKNKKEFPKMVGWFDVTVLIDAAKRAVLSAIFGAYADRRLIHASTLNLDRSKSQRPGFDAQSYIGKSQNDGIWVDYVADLGDGFDSTYAIAHLIGKKELELGESRTLPRADVLVMGGDQIYPTPTREEYRKRFERPYDFAFPDEEPRKNNKKHPLLFMIPGNHDWYDGLTLFLAKYCRGLKTDNSFANWRMYQDRSYFAVQLSEDWWIWGMDTQLADDVDVPQAQYFTDVAKQLGPNAKVILCASVPTWLKADYEEEHYRKAFGMGVDYISTCIIKEHCETAQIYAVISGDQHHYSRYVNEEYNINFITAGGGGAFLHPTHHLKDRIHNINWLRKTTPLTLAKRNGADDESDKACFPDRQKSRSIAWGILKFPFINKQFVWTLGGAYLLLAWLMTLPMNSFGSWGNLFWDLIVSPVTAFVFAVFFMALRKYADFSGKVKWLKKIPLLSPKNIAGGLHAIAHTVLLVLLIPCLITISNGVLNLFDVTPDWFSNSYWYVIFLAEVWLIGGFLGGFIWGAYLFIASYCYAQHYNDAFSSMRLNSYKNFLRMHIQDDKLTIYPVGVERVPERDDWQENPKAQKYNSNEPTVIAKNGVEYRLIEEPIVI